MKRWVCILKDIPAGWPEIVPFDPKSLKMSMNDHREEKVLACFLRDGTQTYIGGPGVYYQLETVT